MPSLRTVAAALVVALPAACGLPGGGVYHGSPAKTPEEALRRFGSEVWLSHVDRVPELRARLGLPWVERWLERREPARVDVDRALVQRELDWLSARHPREGLEPAAQLEWRLLAHFCRGELASLRWADHESLPRAGSGPHLEVLRELDALPIASPVDARAWTRAADRAADVVTAMTDDLAGLAARGVRPTRAVLAAVVSESRALVAGRPFRDTSRDAPLFARYAARLGALDDLEPELWTRLLDEAEESLRARLGPALLRWIDVLETLERETPEERGAWRLPDGDAYYRWRVARACGFEVAPEEVERRAANSLAQVRAELASLAVQLDHPGGLETLLRFAREDPQFLVPSGAEGANELAGLASRRVAEAGALRERVLLPAPVTLLEVAPRRIDEPVEPLYVPSDAADRPAVWRPDFTDPVQWPRARVALEAHRIGWPGRHLRECVTSGRVDVSEFRRHADEPAWARGWDLYALRLAEETGLVEDPYEVVARLELEQWSAALAVADVGLNLRRWSPEETVAWLERSTSRPRRDCERATSAMLADPGDAVAPAIGLSTLLELRRGAEQTLGDAFDLRAFHAQLIGEGPLPLPYVAARVEAWLAGE